MEYTTEQLREIDGQAWRKFNEQLWGLEVPSAHQERTTVSCPAPECGANAGVLVVWLRREGRYRVVLHVNCDVCGRAGRVLPVETPCPDLDEDQMQDAIHQYDFGNVAFCPTCQTRLRIRRSVAGSRAAGAIHYSAYCHRGRATGTFSRARQPG